MAPSDSLKGFYLKIVNRLPASQVTNHENFTNQWPDESVILCKCNLESNAMPFISQCRPLRYWYWNYVCPAKVPRSETKAQRVKLHYFASVFLLDAFNLNVRLRWTLASSSLSTAYHGTTWCFYKMSRVINVNVFNVFNMSVHSIFYAK